MNIRKERRDIREGSNLPYKTLYDPSCTSKDERWVNFLKLTKRDAQSNTPRVNKSQNEIGVFENGSVPKKTKTWNAKDEFFDSYYHGVSYKTFENLKELEFAKKVKKESKLYPIFK